MLKGNRLAGRINKMKTRTRMDKWKKYRAKIRSLPEGAFEEKKHYSGAQVGDLLRKLMREQSFAILKDIEENGLF